jgi:hypothetical protein
MSDIHADAIRRAVAVRRELVESSDMSNVAAIMEQRIQKCRPLQRVVYKAAEGRDSGLASSNVEREVAMPSVPSIGLAKLNDITRFCESSGNCGDFLSMAEEARHEYIKRRNSSVEPGCPVSRPVGQRYPIDEGAFRQLVADKARKQRDRNSTRAEVGGNPIELTTSAKTVSFLGVENRESLTKSNKMTTPAVAANSCTAVALSKWPMPSTFPEQSLAQDGSIPSEP